MSFHIHTLSWITHGQIIERTQKHLFHQAQQAPLPFASPSVLFKVSLQSEIVPSYHNDSCVIPYSVRISIWNNVGSVWRLTTPSIRMSNVCPVTLTQTHMEGVVWLCETSSQSLRLKHQILSLTLFFSLEGRYPCNNIELSSDFLTLYTLPNQSCLTSLS